MYNVHVMMNTNCDHLYYRGVIGLDELYNHRTKKLTHEFMRRRNYEEDEEDSGMVNSLDS